MTTAIVGRTGSGKTYAAKGMVEDMIRAGLPTCIIDPTGAWWGLRVAANGKGEGLPVVIVGGQHADIPLSNDRGAELGQAIAEGRLPTSVVDISEMSGNEQTRFLTAFMEQLYARNRTSLALVMDEADVMAPQNPLPEQRRLQGSVNKIVRRGRIKGFRPIMITQRPAVLDKSVLSQIDTLVAMRLTSPHDRKAIEDWVKGSADADQARPVLESLASLARGEGWVWAPAEDRLERRTFPAITTWDSSASPEPGAATVDVRPLARAELDQLRTLFASPDSAPTDRSKNRSAREGASAAEIAAAEKRGYERGYAQGAADEWARGASAIHAEVTVIGQDAAALAGRLKALGMAIEKIGAEAPKAPPAPPAPPSASTPQRLKRPVASAPKVEANGRLRPIVRAIVDVIHRHQPMALSFDAAARRAGVSNRSSQYRMYRAEVLECGEVVERADGKLMSAPGFARPVDPGADPIEEFAKRLTPSYAAMLRVIARQGGRWLSRDDVAIAAGVSSMSSGLGAGLRELAALSLIVRRGNEVALAPELRADAATP